MARKNKTLLLLRDRRIAGFAILTAVVFVIAAVDRAKADIVYSGIVNINVPDNSNGVFVDFVTGALYFAGGNQGWDFHAFNDGTGLTFQSASFPDGLLATGPQGGTTSVARRLNFGDAIDSTGQYNFGISQGTNFHLTGEFYLGLYFTNESLPNHPGNYGWVLLRTNAPAGFAATIVSYAYQTDGTMITAGAPVPEPSTFTLLGTMVAGALSAWAWRRREQI